MQYLFNGVNKDNLTPRGAIDNHLSTKPFLINEGTVLQRLCPLTNELGVANKALEQVSKFMNIYHVMLLTGLGRMNGVRFREAHDSMGKQRRVDGYIKLVMDMQFISHFVEIKEFYCTSKTLI